MTAVRNLVLENGGCVWRLHSIVVEPDAQMDSWFTEWKLSGLSLKQRVIRSSTGGKFSLGSSGLCRFY